GSAPLETTVAPPKRLKERERPWYAGSGAWLVVTLVGLLFVYWVFSREKTYINLKYGEFLQVLAAARANPSLALQKVKVDHSDIRGEIVVTDPASDGDKNG